MLHFKITYFLASINVLNSWWKVLNFIIFTNNFIYVLIIMYFIQTFILILPSKLFHLNIKWL